MIIFWKSKTCDCLLSAATFDDNGLIMEQPCVCHKIKIGNSIWYNLNPIIRYLLKRGRTFNIKDKQFVKIINVKNLCISRCFTSSKRLIQIEWQHDGLINTDMFDNTKQIYYTELDGAPMYKSKNKNTLILILLYQPYHHTTENGIIGTNICEFGKDDDFIDTNCHEELLDNNFIDTNHDEKLLDID